MVSGPAGEPQPLVAVQRAGRGRTMVFTGEGAWRWRMGLASGNLAYETFWRQALRWIAVQAPPPVAVEVEPPPLGVAVPVTVRVVTPAFEPVSDAGVQVRVEEPGGAGRTLTASLDSSRTRSLPRQPDRRWRPACIASTSSATQAGAVARAAPVCRCSREAATRSSWIRAATTPSCAGLASPPAARCSRPASSTACPERIRKAAASPTATARRARRLAQWMEFRDHLRPARHRVGAAPTMGTAMSPRVWTTGVLTLGLLAQRGRRARTGRHDRAAPPRHGS